VSKGLIPRERSIAELLASVMPRCAMGAGGLRNMPHRPHWRPLARNPLPRANPGKRTSNRLSAP
jgi:hypothetical protein